MVPNNRDPVNGAAHDRPAVAGWRSGLAMRVRLSLLVAVIVALVITALTYLQLRAVERTIEEELTDSARLTAQAIADDLGTRGLNPIDLDDWLHEFIEANPAVRAITVVSADGVPSILASTSSQERAEAADLAREAIGASALRMMQTSALTTVAVPVPRPERRMAVVVTVSMAAVQQASRQGRAIALWFAAPTVLVLTLMVDLLARRLVRHSEELQQRIRAALARADRLAALGEMATSVAHQVGTPLNLISGYVQLVREDRTVDPRTHERLTIVERQIAQVTRVLRAMLDEARRPPARERIQLRRIIEHACETARLRLERSGVRLDLRIDDSLPTIEADATQLELALLNLITNSLDAMPKGGRLTIVATATADGTRIEVTDTGPGIAPELLPRVFEPWVTTKKPGQGTGLGLGITRQVVAAHGGAIFARNGETGGAIVTIELPATTTNAAAYVT
jgi:signal transduction histidine kinase